MLVLCDDHRLKYDPAALGKFDSVCKQVKQNLAHVMAVANEPASGVGRNLGVDCKPSHPRLWQHNLDGTANQLAKIKWAVFNLYSPSFNLCHVEHILNLRKQQVCGCSKCLDNFALRFVEFGFTQDVCHCDYSIQRSSHFVAYVCDKSTLCLIGLVRALLGLGDALCKTPT